MKRILFALAGICCVTISVAVIIAASRSERLFPTPDSESDPAALGTEAVVADANGSGAQPVFHCSETDFDFGLMEPFATATHVFVIENRGQSDLVLTGGETTCKCTLSDLKKAVVKPGEQYPIELTWKSNQATSSFKQSAVVKTNDPQNPEIQLSIRGEVKAILAATPTVIRLESLLPEQSYSTYFQVYSQTWESLEIERVETTNPHFQASETTGSVRQAIGDFENIRNVKANRAFKLEYDGRAERGQLSGLVRVHVYPPEQWEPGSIQTTDADLPASAPEEDVEQEIPFPRTVDGKLVLEIPFDATIIRRVTLFGKPINKNDTVALGTLTAAQCKGRKWLIIGRVRGELVPETVIASVSGIPGLTARVEPKQSQRSTYSFTLTLELTQTLDPSVFSGEDAGLLRVEAVGLPEQDGILEMPVQLIVVR